MRSPDRRCPECASALKIHQPDPMAPSRLLGTCASCGAWCLFDARAGLLAILPTPPDPPRRRRPPARRPPRPRARGKGPAPGPGGPPVVDPDPPAGGPIRPDRLTLFRA
jgi:hypothetical protein